VGRILDALLDLPSRVVNAADDALPIVVKVCGVAAATLLIAGIAGWAPSFAFAIPLGVMFVVMLIAES
jgi:hypothetical protein